MSQPRTTITGGIPVIEGSFNTLDILKALNKNLPLEDRTVQKWVALNAITAFESPKLPGSTIEESRSVVISMDQTVNHIDVCLANFKEGDPLRTRQQSLSGKLEDFKNKQDVIYPQEYRDIVKKQEELIQDFIKGTKSKAEIEQALKQLEEQFGKLTEKIKTLYTTDIPTLQNSLNLLDKDAYNQALSKGIKNLPPPPRLR